MEPITVETRSKLITLLFQDNSELDYDEVTVVLYSALDSNVSDKEFNDIRNKINKAHYHDTHSSTEYLAWLDSMLTNCHSIY